MQRTLVLLGIIGLVALWYSARLWQRPTWLPPESKGVPISAISNGNILPSIGLAAPLPAWIPLPADGTVTGAEVVRPRPPYGAAAVVMLKMHSDPETFIARYSKRLADAGFTVRRTPIPPNLGVDAAFSAYEADNRKSGNVVFVTIRSWDSPLYAQLTFWNAPAPRR